MQPPRNRNESDIFGNGVSYYGKHGAQNRRQPDGEELARELQQQNSRAQQLKSDSKRQEAAEMYHQVQQYREEEHNRKLDNQDMKNRMMSEIQAQLDEKKRIKDEEKRAEKAKDAALQREYDRMMEEREHQRRRPGGNQSRQAQPVPSRNEYNPALGSNQGGNSSTNMAVSNGQLRGKPRQDNFQVGLGGGFFQGTGNEQTKQDKKKVQQEYYALLQDQVAQKKAAKRIETDRDARDALDREMLSQKGSVASKQPTGRVGKKPDNGILPLGGGFGGPTGQRNEPRNEAPAYNDVDQYRDQVDNYNAPRDVGYASDEANYQPYQDQGGSNPTEEYNPYSRNPYQSESAGQGNTNPADDQEFQRRMEEYYRENGSSVGNANMNPYSAPDDLPAYSREQDANPYADQGNPYASSQGQPDYQPYQRSDVDASPAYQKPQMDNPYDRVGQTTPTEKRMSNAQHNYLVNNPIAPDMPQRRAPGGFRAHQDIRHDHMGVDRQAKIPLTQGNAKDAYQAIKKKYGNHSAQYNILTGN